MSVLAKYCIHILGDERQKISQTLDSISRQNYPNIEVKVYVAKVFDGINELQIEIKDEYEIVKHIFSTSVDYHTFIKAGTEYVNGAFAGVNQIFKTFPHVELLFGTLLPKKNKHLFMPKTLLPKTVDTSVIFFSHSLSHKAITTEVDFNSFCQRLVEFSKPHFTSLYVASGYGNEILLKNNSVFPVVRFNHLKNAYYISGR